MWDSKQLWHSTRRHFLSGSATGFGLAAASGILGWNGAAAQSQSRSESGALRGTHFPARARRVIYLFQSGGPSHV
ncbi:MAG: sulfatase, partial [Planctomycetia bacterium]